jgi:hypothetical protein
MTQFILDIKKPDQKKKISTKIKLALDKVSKFYEPAMHPQWVYLNLIYSREEFNEKIGRQTPDWMAGFADKNVINLLSPNVMEKHSSHPKNYFDKLLTHELAHIYTAEINNRALMWLDEGLALNIAEQKKKVEIPKDDWKYFVDNNGISGKIPYKYFSDHSGYKIAYWLTNVLLNNFGKESIIELLKIQTEQNNINKKIEQVLQTSVKQIINMSKKRLQLI